MTKFLLELAAWEAQRPMRALTIGLLAFCALTLASYLVTHDRLPLFGGVSLSSGVDAEHRFAMEEQRAP